MGLNPAAVGQVTAEISHEYGWKDVALYALGIGATCDDLDFLYESRGPKVYPTYAVVPAYHASRAAFGLVGGNPLGIVHHAQKIALHRPFDGSGKLKSVGKVAGVYDLRRMAMAVIETETRDEQGALVSETEFSIIFRLDGNFDGAMPPRRASFKPPAREPDFAVREKTSEQQAALYRLSGDDNPLHIDPEIAALAGFGRPILHGLCTYGFVGRAVLRALGGNEPSRLKTLAGEFRKPVWPGETLVTQGWRQSGLVLLRAHTEERPNEYVFQNGYAELSSAP